MLRWIMVIAAIIVLGNIDQHSFGLSSALWSTALGEGQYGLPSRIYLFGLGVLWLYDLWATSRARSGALGWALFAGVTLIVVLAAEKAMGTATTIWQNETIWAPLLATGHALGVGSIGESTPRNRVSPSARHEQ